MSASEFGLNLVAKTLKKQFRVFILEGVDFSGKTTFSRLLKEFLGGAIVVHAGGPPPQPRPGCEMVPLSRSRHYFDLKDRVPDQLKVLRYEHDRGFSADKAIKEYCGQVEVIRKDLHGGDPSRIIPTTVEQAASHERILHDQILSFLTDYDGVLDCPVILDRSYIGEAVYGAIYRERMANPWLIHKHLRKREDVAVINLTSDVSIDDGKSINHNMRMDEDGLFELAMETFDGVSKVRIQMTKDRDHWRDFSDVVVETADRLL